MKINILSHGRSHLCDLARELDKQGFDIRFYSFVPTKRTIKFGLPKEGNVSLFLIMLPFLILERKLFRKIPWFKFLRIRVQDWVTSMLMRRCDVCIAWCGDFVKSPQKAKKMGALYIAERGCKHIIEQKRILESIGGDSIRHPISDREVQRELTCYDMADYVSVAAEHVKRSFEMHGYSPNKLFVNSYGVNLSNFYPTSDRKKKYDVIMVGGWRYRKGCDLIVTAIKRLQLKFLHVGSIIDLEFPKENMFVHVDAVNEWDLVKYYHQAKIFLLPSREEGLAMVQAQAIACNLPLIGSPDSGAEDLKAMVAKSEFVTLIRDFSVDAVCYAIQEALANYDMLGDNLYAGEALKNLTWESYGKRYAEFLYGVIAK